MSPHEILRCTQDDISPAGCHSECSQGSGSTAAEILRCAQDDISPAGCHPRAQRRGSQGSGSTGHVEYDFTGLNIETLVMSGKWFRVRALLKNTHISELLLYHRRVWRRSRNERRVYAHQPATLERDGWGSRKVSVLRCGWL